MWTQEPLPLLYSAGYNFEQVHQCTCVCTLIWNDNYTLYCIEGSRSLQLKARQQTNKYNNMMLCSSRMTYIFRLTPLLIRALTDPVRSHT